MELKFPFFPILFTFLIFILMLFRIWKKSKINNTAPNLPPGPWKLPLIGSMHHLFGSLPHHRLTDLAKKYGPLMHLQLCEVTNIVISSAEMAKEVMKTHDVIFADRPRILAAEVILYNCTDIVFGSYGDNWRQMRKICSLELLTVKRVQSFRSIREEEVLKLIKSMASSSNAGSAVNFSKMFTSVTYNIISRAAFGKIWNGQDIFIPTLKKLVVAIGAFTLADVFPSIKLIRLISMMDHSLARIHQEMDKILQNIIDDHKSKRGAVKSGDKKEDLVDVLLNFQDQSDLDVPLTDDNVKAVILDMFAGGTETSATTVEWVMSELLKNPRVMTKAQEEVRRIFGTKGNIDEEGLNDLHYLKLIVKETLRLHPPLPFLIPRECRENCVINGYDISSKSRIIINAWAIGRDPNYWKEADKFYPERFQDCSIDYRGNDFQYLPFGAGRRMCPGMSFGIINVEFPLAQLLYHFDWKLPAGVNPVTLDMDEVFGIVTGRKNDLHLIPIPYSSPLVQ